MQHLPGIRPERCEGCPLKTPLCADSGPIDAPFVIVGEGPGGSEIAENKPFVGDSGKVLRSCFPDDFDWSKVLITNATQCLPKKDKDKKQLEKCVRGCRSRLLETISAYPREVIFAVGNGALWGLTGNVNYKITKERGKIFQSSLAKRGIVAAYHPSYVLRGGGSYKIFREDARYALSLFEGGKHKQAREISYKQLLPIASHKRFITNLLKLYGIVGADIETTGLSAELDNILDVGLNIDSSRTYIITGEHLWYYADLWDIPKSELRWIWHNGKFDVRFLRRPGLPARVDEDTMLLSYALNEQGGIHDLETLAKDNLGAPDYKDKVDPYVDKKTGGFENVPKHILYGYRLAPDCAYTIQTWKKLRPSVREDKGLDKLYSRILLPASEMLSRVEARGFYVHQYQVERNLDFYGGNDAKGIRGVVPELADKLNSFVAEANASPINPNSWQQVSVILYDVFQLKNKWSSRGTDEAVIKHLQERYVHPTVKGFLSTLLEYREAAKAYGTYVKGIHKHIRPDGCIHSTYKIHGTRTGRLASSDPNLQNIPRDPVLRSQFGARPGHVLLEFDLDQAELRCLGALSNDPALCHIYETDGLSLHKEVSKSLWGDDWTERYARSEISKEDPIYLAAYEEYMRTKALNFGIVYGREAGSIAEEFKVSKDEAQKWVDKWFVRFPQAGLFIQACRNAVVEGKTLITPFGRKKRFGAVSSSILHSLQNEAANFPHQSCASDITLVTAIKVQPRLEKLAAYIVNLVHDSIIVECPNVPSVIQNVREIVEPEMVKTPVEWGIDRIPFKTDCKAGDQWGKGDTLPELLAA